MSPKRHTYILGGNKDIVYYLFDDEYARYLRNGIKLERVS